MCIFASVFLAYYTFQNVVASAQNVKYYSRPPPTWPSSPPATPLVLLPT